MNLLRIGFERLRRNGLKATFRKTLSFIADRTWRRMSLLEKKVTALERRSFDLGLDSLGGKIDYRLLRLEVLQHYADQRRLALLDDEQRKVLQTLGEGKEMETLPRRFPMFPVSEVDISETIRIEKDPSSELYYWDFLGKKLYMAYDYDLALLMAKGLYGEFFTDTPHKYLEPEKDGVDVPNGAVLADVGAAEGAFGMMFIDRCRKLYLFDNEQYWIENLRKTFAPYKDKVEIVKGTVGDGPNDIRLDDFFKNKEAPDFIKMDIEGYEPFAVRGMEGLLRSDNPLTLLICTYHRQGDWDYFYDMLHEKFNITSSSGYFWNVPDPAPPFFRRGVMRAVKKIQQ